MFGYGYTERQYKKEMSAMIEWRDTFWEVSFLCYMEDDIKIHGTYY